MYTSPPTISTYQNVGFIKIGFNIYEESWTYGGTSSAKSIKNHVYMDENESLVRKKVGKELIITNYTKP